MLCYCSCCGGGGGKTSASAMLCEKEESNASRTCSDELHDTGLVLRFVKPHGSRVVG
jgi:hypothetical protein